MLIGVDIAEVARFENVGEKFLKRCFTEEELAYFNKKNSPQTVAANFAAKEAFSKALGTGVRGFELYDISVLRNEEGKPYFKFSKNVAEIMNSMGIKSVDVSLSHDGGFAVATVAAEQKKGIECFEKAVSKTDTDCESIISYRTVKKSIPIRKRDTHKGDYGKIFLVAGSKGLTGAGIMASEAALKSGGGLITLGCCESLNNIFEISLCEVMTLPLPDSDGIIARSGADKIIEQANNSSVVCFGCGLSCTEDICYILERLLAESKVPVVVDADGINALAKNINILKAAKVPVVLTPHIGEFSRLSGMTVEDILSDRQRAASDFAQKWKTTVVLKSDYTIVAYADGRVYTNLLGNSGMATGGSGDVLAGVIASFIGQKIENAAECGVYIHSLAGDMAAWDKGEYGMTPSDIIENIPYAIDFVCGKEEF